MYFRRICCALALFAFASGTTAKGQEPFSKIVGAVKVGPVKKTNAWEVPYITWGGDVATFYANGGKTTRPGTLFAKQGLNLNLTPGDDFPAQVKRYLQGDTPFLRGTMRMLGMASEVIGADVQTKPVVFLQLTWSRGDHLVARENVKVVAKEGDNTADTLKGKKIVLQQGGPHVGMLDDILRTAQLTWNDITVVWTDDLTGPNGPAERFRKDKSIDGCMCISPDMAGLTGGLRSKGTGAEGTVRGAHVLVTTADMTRSIADVYACRKDFYDSAEGKQVVQKFVAAYLKSCEDVLALKTQYEKRGKAGAPQYWSILQLTQDIYGKDVIPTLEIDAHGLISDCAFVGLAGNNSFFKDKGNLNGFKAKEDAALKLAVEQKYAKVESGFFPPDLDYAKIKQLGAIAGPVEAKSGGEVTGDFAFDPEPANTILSFTISFEPNQFEFDDKVYGQQFLRAVQSASTFGNAIIVVRGHSDPTQTLADMVRAGMAKGILKRTGTPANRRYFVNGRPLDIKQIDTIAKLINEGAFDGVAPSPRQTMQAALNLSELRAKNVRDAVVKYAKEYGLNLNEAQIQPQGVGVMEPVIPRPHNLQEAKENMRVEFRLVRKNAEPESALDFDF